MLYSKTIESNIPLIFKNLINNLQKKIVKFMHKICCSLHSTVSVTNSRMLDKINQPISASVSLQLNSSHSYFSYIFL